jgi:hypothetical protein
MNHDNIKAIAREMTTDQLTEAVEAVDPDWLDHYADLDRAVAVYLEYGWPEFHREIERIYDEEMV